MFKQKLAVALVASLAIAGGIWFFTPINPSSAAVPSTSHQTDLFVNIAPFIALSVNNCDPVTDPSSNQLTISIPFPSNDSYGANCQTVGVTTNAPGYTLSTKALSNNGTNSLVRQNLPVPTPVPFIPSIVSTATPASPSTLTTDSWGFAVAGKLGFDTTYTTDPNSTSPSIATNRFANLPTTNITIADTTTIPNPTDNFVFYYATRVPGNKQPGTYQTTVTYTAVGKPVPLPLGPPCDTLTTNQECFAFTIDTRMTNTLDTDPNHYSGTATQFLIPVSGMVNANKTTWASLNHPYNWILNCGDGTPDRVVSGTGSSTNTGVACNYATPGMYRITIKSNGAAAMGWMNAFGFSYNNNFSGAHDTDNRNLIKTIDTPLTNNMRTKGSTWRFAFMFEHAQNATGIPADLFSNIDTSGNADLSYMFLSTFFGYAHNSTTATIPSGLFNSINTNGSTDMSYMFYNTFRSYASNSSTGAIPSGIFNSINTSTAVNLRCMFQGTFAVYARPSASATIPSGLFNSINTSSATDLGFMFDQAFDQYAQGSTIGTIPANLFNGIDTSSATNLNRMFYQTFSQYAFANKANDSTPDTDINTIWGNANLSAVTAASAGGSNGVFYGTFSNMPSLVGTAQTFIDTKLSHWSVPRVPTTRAYTFNGTGVTDLASLNANWK